VLTNHFASSGRSHPLITLRSIFFQFPHYLSKLYLVCLLLNSCVFFFTRLKVIDMSLLAYLFSAYASVTISKLIGKIYFQVHASVTISKVIGKIYFQVHASVTISKVIDKIYFQVHASVTISKVIDKIYFQVHSSITISKVIGMIYFQHIRRLLFQK